MYHRRLAALTVLAACAVLTACSATQPVRVLTLGERRWIASVGGPLLPNHVPTGLLPYTDVGMMWGARENLTLSANAHLLAAAFGVAGADVGAAKRLHAQRGNAPELTGQVQLYAFAGSGGARVYPNVSGVASWRAGERGLLYTGLNLTGRLNAGGKGLVATPLVGVQRDVTKRLILQLEGKWMAANIDMSRGLFEGENSIGGRGGMALQLGVQVKR